MCYFAVSIVRYLIKKYNCLGSHLLKIMIFELYFLVKFQLLVYTEMTVRPAPCNSLRTYSGFEFFQQDFYCSHNISLALIYITKKKCCLTYYRHITKISPSSTMKNLKICMHQLFFFCNAM